MDLEQLALLVERYRQGDGDAFTEIYEMTRPSLHKMALSLMHSESDAQDLLQEAYAEILGSLQSLQNVHSFLPWARSILYHLAYRKFRSQKRDNQHRISGDADILLRIRENSEEADPETPLWRKDLERIISSALDELPVEQSSVLIAYYYDELSVKEIAEALDLSPGTVKSRLHYGRKALRSRFRDYEKKHGIKLRSLGIPAVGAPIAGKCAAIAISAALVVGVAEPTLFTPTEGGDVQVAATISADQILTTEKPHRHHRHTDLDRAIRESHEDNKRDDSDYEIAPKQTKKERRAEKKKTDEDALLGGLTMSAVRYGMVYGDDSGTQHRDGYRNVDNNVSTSIPYGTDRIFGTAPSGTEVALKLARKTYHTTADSNGEYTIKSIATSAVGAKYAMAFSNDNASYKVKGKVVSNAKLSATFTEESGIREDDSGTIAVDASFANEGDRIAITAGDQVLQYPCTVSSSFASVNILCESVTLPADAGEIKITLENKFGQVLAEQMLSL